MPTSIPGLQPIHLPASPGWWPPAPGWWVLAALLLAVMAWLAMRWLRMRKRSRTLAAALHAFDAALGDAVDAPARLAAASAWLRRAARTRDPAALTLEGSAWLAFLDGDDPARPFSQGAGNLLGDGGFRRRVDADIAPALLLARTRFAQMCVGVDGETRSRRRSHA
ncbi:MAG: DUF4381 domain-containing protein [Proteobacteria bacterium]|nr:DUF4381 domain-containing protein [Pseudomonadota bacterium]